MVWQPISEFTQAQFESGHQFWLYSPQWVQELLAQGVSIGYPFDAGSGTAPFEWQVALVDSDGEFIHVAVPPGDIEYPTHFAVIVPPPGAQVFDYNG